MNIPKSPAAAHRRLEWINLITSMGDHISYFAVVAATYRLSNSVAFAAYTVPTQSLAIAVGGATFPFVSGRFNPRTLLISTQLLSGLLMLALIALIHAGGPLPAIFATLFIQTVLHQYFAGTRESYSKSLDAGIDHRSLQAALLHGLYSAQFVGPLLSLLLIRTLDEEVPIAIDALSFLIAGFYCWNLPVGTKPASPSILRPFQYLTKRGPLLQLFVIRSFLYWIPTGIFNYMVFSVVSERFGLKVVDTAWTYAAIGLGSLIGTRWLRQTKLLSSRSGWLGRVARLSDAHVAFAALLGLSITRISFIYVPSVYIALAIVAVGGIFNGLNAVASQSLRRNLTSDREFPEIVGLEIVVGRATDWGVATLCFGGLYGAHLNFEQSIWMSAAGLFLLAWLHLGRELRGV